MRGRHTGCAKARQAGFWTMNSHQLDRTHKNKKIITIAIIVFLLVGFAWVISQVQRNIPQPASTPTATPDASFIVHIPQKALWKNYVTVAMEAPAGTSCRLTYIAPSGATRQTDTTAKVNGLCEWRWKIEEAEGKGHGRLIFTIGEFSQTHFLEILSSF
jgi:hypothetical protein